MPTFDIIKETKYNDTFKNKAIIGRYDLSTIKLQERFVGAIDLPDEWNVGIIVGPSGSGKSTIAKDVFNYSFMETKDINSSVVDSFGDSSLHDIESTLCNVGFSSAPSWIKPYSVLSNGEKMRVDLARAILSNDDPIVFDEFTSVVDREIAKIGATATAKTIKRLNKRFIAISCHYDIVEWLEPDWVFDTQTFKFKITRGLVRRPDIEVEIRKTKGYWDMFSKYHYLDGNCHPASDQFVSFVNNKPVAFIAVLHFPHPTAKNIKRVSRFVVHPEWQGVSLGRKMIESVGNYYIGSGNRFRIVTSNPILTNYFYKSKNWIIDRQSTSGKLGKNSKSSLSGKIRSNIYTIGAEYKPTTNEATHAIQ